MAGRLHEAEDIPEDSIEAVVAIRERGLGRKESAQ
jgi:hypothetical protein